MAERRMFASRIIDSDAFLEMPLSAQALYFHLSIRADDDGFINNPRKIQRIIGAADDDLKLLNAKSFLIPFDSGVVVIKHWKIHNYIRGDRYKPTVCQDELSALKVNKNGAYSLLLPEESPTLPPGIPNDNQVSYQLETQVSIGKYSIGKEIVKDSTYKGEYEGERTKKEKEEQSTTPDYSKTTFSSEMIAAIEMWLQYKKERREGYKPMGLKALISEIQNNIARYGEGSVIELIRHSMASGWRGIAFDRLKRNSTRQRDGGVSRSDGQPNSTNPFVLAAARSGGGDVP